MRLRDPVPVSEILGLCAPFVIPGEVTSALLSAAPGPFIGSLEPPEAAGPDSLAFLGPRVPLHLREALRAALILAEPGFAPVDPLIPVLPVRSVHAAMAALLRALSDCFLREAPFAAGAGNRVAASATVAGVLEGDVFVGAGAYVGPGSFVGKGTRIEPNATVLENCRIGRGCVIQSGAVIGCAGFGFFSEEADSGTVGLAAMPHPAGVVIADDCFIGANAVVAAGVLRPTALGAGCKLDSHVQIAHNVRLGSGCLLASQSGIAGSTVAGDRLRLGGAASVDGHLRLGDDVSVAACSGVTKDLPAGSVVAGFPARPIREWRREQIRLRRGDA